MPTKTALRALLPALLVLGMLAAPAARAGGNTGMSWGYGFYGQLGYPAPDVCGAFLTPCSKHPKAMEGISDATQISASQNLTLALLDDGSVHAWGANQYGQLGDESTSASASGATPVGLGSGVVQVAAGYDHGLALLADGTVMAWGSNATGQLGAETSGPELCGGTIACSTKPLPVPGLSGAIAVSAGFGFSAALLSNGSVVAWGKDNFGQLGDGTGIATSCSCVDHPVPVPGIGDAMALSAGNTAAAVLLSDGGVRSWGLNEFGTLGTGDTHDNPACKCLGPVAPSGLGAVRQISSGGLFEMALRNDGGVSAWGYNQSGQLGNGSINGTGCLCVPTPAPVLDLSGAQAVSAGASHALALLGDGSLRAWGDDEDSALGDGAEVDRSTPVPVSGLGGVTAPAGGGVNSYALVGPSQALSVELAGAGAGTVGSADGILCGPSCSTHLPQGRIEILRAQPATGSAFAGWAGPCSGQGPACRLKMDADQAVSATFGPPKGTAVTKLKLNRRKRSATISFSAPGAITGYECLLVRPKPKKKKKHHRGGHGTARAAGAKASYAPCASPKAYRHLKPGAYTFRVRALDVLGADEHPAVRHFVVRKPKPKRRSR